MVGASKTAQHDVMRGHVEQAKMAASNSRGADHCWGCSSPAVADDDNGPRQHGAWRMEHGAWSMAMDRKTKAAVPQSSLTRF
jgi:hypothetical protein